MKEKLFSVTQKDFDFQDTKGTGKGGQARNKTSSAIRCTHKASGAVGFCQDDRKQHINKRIAFERCIATREFQVWLKMETSRMSGEAERLERAVNARVNEAMQPKNLLVEVVEGGDWVPEVQ